MTNEKGKMTEEEINAHNRRLADIFMADEDPEKVANAQELYDMNQLGDLVATVVKYSGFFLGPMLVFGYISFTTVMVMIGIAFGLVMPVRATNKRLQPFFTEGVYRETGERLININTGEEM